jgi:hypothetical protein
MNEEIEKIKAALPSGGFAPPQDVPAKEGASKEGERIVPEA